MGRLIAVFFLVAVAFFVFLKGSGQDVSVTSPIPKVFGVNNSPKVLNSWFPRENRNLIRPYKLELSAKSALVVDYETGDIIFSKNPNEKLPAASTIKIMTALIALGKSDLGDIFAVSEKANSVGENSMGLTTGERLTLKELLLGLMLVSGNDAAVAIAEGVSGDEAKFVDLMNAKAKELGLSDSKFINASGLDEDGKEQYTTAHDMLVIARYVWKNFPEFRKITSTEHIYLDANENHKGFDLYNDTNLLTTYPGVGGIKPGFTWTAGLCLVTFSENENMEILGVILGSDDRRGEMKELLDLGFATYGIKVSHPALDL